jgi:hypothetical protein
MNKENLDKNSKRVPPYLDPELSQETDLESLPCFHEQESLLI